MVVLPLAAMGLKQGAAGAPWQRQVVVIALIAPARPFSSKSNSLNFLCSCFG